MTIKTVGELIERLEEFDPDTPVTIASQPGWPMEHALADVGGNDDAHVYLIEGQHIGYLPDEARTATGW